jgi:hypothetical protein
VAARGDPLAADFFVAGILEQERSNLALELGWLHRSEANVCTAIGQRTKRIGTGSEAD